MSDRRAFLKLLSLVSTLPVLSGATLVSGAGGVSRSSNSLGSWLLSAFDDLEGKHYVGVYDEQNDVWVAKVRVSQRYHSCSTRNKGTRDYSAKYSSASKRATHSSSKAIFVARRPGNQAVILDLNAKTVVEVTAPTGRHFFGHAAEDALGRVWFSEHDYQQGRSLLVCRTGEDLAVEEIAIDLEGHGPHELIFLNDGATAAVGLGGIQTHPDYPRKKLNIERMQSELLIVDTVKKVIKERWRPDDPQVSLRHLDVATDIDAVVIGGQYQGPAYNQFALVYVYLKHQGLIAMKAPESVWRSMNQYIASVRVNTEKQEVLVSCPRSNSVHLFSLSEGVWLSQYRLRDPGGIAMLLDGSYLISTGEGEIVCLSSNNDALTLVSSKRVSDTRWDNHMDRVMLS